MHNRERINQIEVFTGIRPGQLHYGNILLLQQLPKHSVVMIADRIMPCDNATLTACFTIIRNLGFIPILESRISNITNLADVLKRYTTLSHVEKSTSLRAKQVNNLTLLDYFYPVLMMADVLFFKPKNIYVGYDQTTNIEFIADHCKRLEIPYDVKWSIYDENKTLYDLNNINIKMSKSSDQDGTISIMESIDAISKKINKAPTNSFPIGVEKDKVTDNWMLFYSIVDYKTSHQDLDAVYHIFENQNWSDFKKALILKIEDYSNFLLSNHVCDEKEILYFENKIELPYLNNDIEQLIEQLNKN